MIPQRCDLTVVHIAHRAQLRRLDKRRTLFDVVYVLTQLGDLRAHLCEEHDD